jgi:hypothetical protein
MKAPEGATWICLVKTSDGTWMIVSYGTDLKHCEENAAKSMRMMAMCGGGGFYGKYFEPYDPNKDYENFRPENDTPPGERYWQKQRSV